jgi:hypothetical protein
MLLMDWATIPRKVEMSDVVELPSVRSLVMISHLSTKRAWEVDVVTEHTCPYGLPSKPAFVTLNHGVFLLSDIRQLWKPFPDLTNSYLSYEEATVCLDLWMDFMFPGRAVSNGGAVHKAMVLISDLQRRLDEIYDRAESNSRLTHWARCVEISGGAKISDAELLKLLKDTK